MRSLREAAAGETCRIRWLLGAPLVQALDCHGIRTGSWIRVLQNGKTDMIIGHEGVRLAIRAAEAERIKV